MGIDKFHEEQVQIPSKLPPGNHDDISRKGHECKIMNIIG